MRAAGGAVQALIDAPTPRGSSSDESDAEGEAVFSSDEEAGHTSGSDFRTWWTGYAELTSHVRADLRPLHLLTAVQDGVKLNCEAHFHALSRTWARSY